MIEIGMPFSDPLADGPIIQHSSEVALRNGMSVQHLFSQLKEFSDGHRSPANGQRKIYLMGYLNPVMQFGFENFCQQASACGIRGLIIPDLPLSVYTKDYRSLFIKHQLSNIFLITPQTSDERIREIDEASTDFIYLVSSSSTTGGERNDSEEKEKYFQRIKSMNLKNRLVIGFGIKDAAGFNQASKYANGAIVGSSFIDHLRKNGVKNITDFVSSIQHPASNIQLP